MIEEINYPDVMLKRKARALLRHWFNRVGTDGVNRIWNMPGQDKDEDKDEDDDAAEKAKAKKAKAKNVAHDVPKETHDARLKWAKEAVAAAGYDTDNPPPPPLWLYLALDVKPSYMPDEVDAISDAGGVWLWRHMRKLESMDIESVDYSGKYASVDSSARVWQPAFRAQQKEAIKEAYEEFILSVDDMSKIPQAKDVAYSYTAGSGKFNKYLLYPADGGDPANIPKYGAGKGGVAGNDKSGDIGPPDLLHRLYKLINRCPRLPKDAVFLRSVRTLDELPHNMGKAALVEPKVGTGCLNVTFMSTSSAAPDDYLEGQLGNFFIKPTSCCLMATTCPRNSPVLPLVLGGKANSVYEHEQEVLLPPGLVLV